MAKRDHSTPFTPSQPHGAAGKNRDTSKDKRQNSRRAPSQRPAGGLLWLFGHHAVLSALANPQRQIHRILVTAEVAQEIGPRLVTLRQRVSLPMEEMVGRVDLDEALPPGAVHQGVAALVSPLPSVTLETVIGQARDLTNCVVVILDQVTDPHNVGAIVRSSAAFGALAVVVPDRHSPDETGTLAKSASGALEALPLVRVTNVVRSLEDLKKAGFWIAGLAGDAKHTLASQKLSGKIALVMGAEGDGMRRLTREHCDYLVKLPMSSKVESLNVSNAAAVALYELRRDSL